MRKPFNSNGSLELQASWIVMLKAMTVEDAGKTIQGFLQWAETGEIPEGLDGIPEASLQVFAKEYIAKMKKRESSRTKMQRRRAAARQDS